MDSVREQVEALLKENGAVLVREKKHRIWRLADGRMFTTAKSPSDVHAWANCLRGLKRMLGHKAREKTKEDFEFQKRERNYSKPVVHTKEFLANLPEREERPKTPVSESPLVWMKRKLAAEKAEKDLKIKEEKEREIFKIGNKLPPATLGKGNGHRASARSGRVVQYSPDRIAEINRSLKVTIGEIVRTKGLEELKMETINEGTVGTEHGSIESVLKNAKEQMQIHKASENSHRMEYLRYQAMVEQLEQTMKLANAPRASLKDLLTGSSQTQEQRVGSSRDGMKPKGYWKEKCKEVIATSPLPLGRVGLVDELLTCGETTRGNAQQVLYKGIREGWLIEDVEGHVQYREEIG